MRCTPKDFALLSQQTRQMLSVIRDRALTPETQRRQRRHYRLTQVADLLGLSESYLRKLEADGRIPARHSADHARWSGWSLEEINRIRDTMALNPYHDEATDKPVIVATVHFKGGVGKTTTAVLQAQHFAERGYRVLLVDLDPQASATALFFNEVDADIADEATLVDFFDPENDRQDLVDLPQATYWPRIDIIPANLSLYNAELFLPAAQVQDPTFRFWELLESGLHSLDHRYDIIVLDCPPALSYCTLNAIWAATGMVTPIPPSLKDYASAAQFFGMVHETVGQLTSLSERPKHWDFVRLLVSRHDGTRNSQAMAAALRQFMGDYVMQSTLYNTTVIPFSDFKMTSPYEMEAIDYAGDKKTFLRAREILQSVNDEILRDIRLTWPSTREAAEKEVLTVTV